LSQGSSPREYASGTDPRSAPPQTDMDARGPPGSPSALLGRGRGRAPTSPRTGDSVERSGSAVCGLERLDPQARAAALAVLQRTTGNALVARQAEPRSGDPASTAAGRTPVASGGDGPNRTAIDTALRTKNVADAYFIEDYWEASTSERHELIDIVRHDRTWPNPARMVVLERLWASFGERVAAQAEAHWEAWADCVAQGAPLYDLDALQDLRSSFGRDVTRLAFDYIRKNDELVTKEMDRISGAALGGKIAKAHGGELDVWEAERPLRELQGLAGEAARAEEAAANLRDVVVGSNREVTTHARGTTVRWTEAKFDPDRRPDRDLMDVFGITPWDAVNGEWEKTQAVLAGLRCRSPLLHAAITGGHGKARALAEAPVGTLPEEAQAQLFQLSDDIEKARKALGGIDPRDLYEIHEQLLLGRKQSSEIDWSGALNRGIARDVLADHERREFWLDLGLTTLQAAAFVFSELATGGLGTAFWLTVGVALTVPGTAQSWEEYGELAAVAEATAHPDLVVVATGQADAARMGAILDSVFLFLDVAGPAVTAARGALGARRLAMGLEGATDIPELRMLDSLSEVERKDAIEEGISEFGALETAQRAGRSVDELMQLAGMQGRIGAVTPEKAADLLSAIRALTRNTADMDQLLLKALDVHGPVTVLRAAGGWAELAKILPTDTGAARRLMWWRDDLYQRVERYVREELKGEIKRTGRATLFKNDLDMSTLGKGAAANRERALGFIAARLGVPVDEINHVLHASVLVDPRRMHLYDKLPEAESIAGRATEYEDRLDMSRRLYHARKQGDELEVKSLEAQMERRQLSELPYTPLSPGERVELGELSDRLYDKFAQAEQATDKARLAEEIAHVEALLKAEEPEALKFGGAVAEHGSRREKLGGYELASAPPTPRAHARGSMLAMNEALDEAERLLTSSRMEDLVDGLQKLGKVGERQAKTGGEALVAEAAEVSARLDGLADELGALKEAAESGNLVPDAAAHLRAEGVALLDELRRSSEDAIQRLTRGFFGLGPEIPDPGVDVQGAIRLHLSRIRAADAAKRHLTRQLGVMGRAAGAIDRREEGP